MANPSSTLRRWSLRALALGALLVLLTPPVILGVVSAHVPVGRPAGYAFAAQDLEDCDLDGYDDKTGAPVPWAGFDSSRGDVIPAGWDGKSESWTGPHTNSNTGTSAKSSSGSSSSNSSGSGSQSGSNGSGSKSGSASNSSAASSSGSTSGGSGTAGATSKTTVVPGRKSAADRVITKTIVTTVTVAPTITSTQTIVSTGGEVSVSDADGAALHADSSLQIAGSKFAALVEPLDISVDTVDTKLDNVSSDERGGFTSTVDLPKGLSAGVHQIIVSYHGLIIVQQPVTLGPPTAGTFGEALGVGFSDANPDRNAGALTLAGLAVVGLVAYGSQSVPRRRTRQGPAIEVVPNARLLLDEAE